MEKQEKSGKEQRVYTTCEKEQADMKKSIGASRLRFFRDPDPVPGKEKSDARNAGYNTT